jgi:hypothetical protein
MNCVGSSCWFYCWVEVMWLLPFLFDVFFCLLFTNDKGLYWWAVLLGISVVSSCINCILHMIG